MVVGEIPQATHGRTLYPPSSPSRTWGPKTSLGKPALRRMPKSQPAKPLEFAPGQIFARRFVLGDFLGAGGAAPVYRAYDLETQRDVALKITRPERRAFHGSELAALKILFSPPPGTTVSRHIVRYYGSGSIKYGTGLLDYLALEYVEGTTLSKEIRTRGGIPLPRALEIVSQVCFGLKYAAEQGVFHRDIKPGNILITRIGELPVIIDFGLSFYQSPNPDSIAGTPIYMAPEAFTRAPLDQRTDIYSLGVTLYEMTTGSSPFEDTRDLSALLQQKAEGVPDNIALPPAVLQLIRRMTTPKAEDRISNYDTLVAEIEAVRKQISALSSDLAEFERTLPITTKEDDYSVTENEITEVGAMTAPNVLVNRDPTEVDLTAHALEIPPERIN